MGILTGLPRFLMRRRDPVRTIPRDDRLPDLTAAQIEAIRRDDQARRADRAANGDGDR
jgi:hypothetical protein